MNVMTSERVAPRYVPIKGRNSASSSADSLTERLPFRAIVPHRTPDVLQLGYSRNINEVIDLWVSVARKIAGSVVISLNATHYWPWRSSTGFAQRSKTSVGGVRPGSRPSSDGLQSD